MSQGLAQREFLCVDLGELLDKNASGFLVLNLCSVREGRSPHPHPGQLKICTNASSIAVFTGFFVENALLDKKTSGLFSSDFRFEGTVRPFRLTWYKVDERKSEWTGNAIPATALFAGPDRYI